MALRDINLVPEEIVRRRMMLRHGECWAGVLLACVLPILAAAAFMTMRVLPARRMAVSVADSRRNVAQTLAAIEEAREAMARTAYLRSVAKRVRWSDALAELAKALPATTWLSEVNVEAGVAPAQPTVMTFKGYSVSHEELGLFLRQLSASPLLRDVTLEFSREHERTRKGDDGADILERTMHFGIVCAIGRGDGNGDGT